MCRVCSRPWLLSKRALEGLLVRKKQPPPFCLLAEQRNLIICREGSQRETWLGAGEAGGDQLRNRTVLSTFVVLAVWELFVRKGIPPCLSAGLGSQASLVSG